MHVVTFSIKTGASLQRDEIKHKITCTHRIPTQVHVYNRSIKPQAQVYDTTQLSSTTATTISAPPTPVSYLVFHIHIHITPSNPQSQ